MESESRKGVVVADSTFVTYRLLRDMPVHVVLLKTHIARTSTSVIFFVGGGGGLGGGTLRLHVRPASSTCRGHVAARSGDRPHAGCVFSSPAPTPTCTVPKSATFAFSPSSSSTFAVFTFKEHTHTRAQEA
jgi:hypothetical protein